MIVVFFNVKNVSKTNHSELSEYRWQEKPPKRKEYLPAYPGRLGLTREEKSDLLGTMSPERIEKIENERSMPHPDECFDIQ